VLGASNYTFAEARWSEGLADCLRTIGGVPKAIVCDRPAFANGGPNKSFRVWPPSSAVSRKH
jgi:hypothetical protein